MASTGGAITVVNNDGTSIVVTITNDSGASVSAYTDEALSTSIALPATVTATTTFWLGVDGDYTISVTASGVEVANTPDGTRKVRLTGGERLVFKPNVDSNRLPDLSGTYAPVTVAAYGASGAAAVGDSITANFGAATSTTAYQPDNHFDQGLVVNGQSPLWRGVFATSGYTLEQIRDTHISSVVALSPKPSACLILGGTNNVKTDGTGAGFVVANAIAVVQQMCTTLLAAKIRPILATIPTRADNTTINANVDSFNRALCSYARSNGFDVIDYHKALADPSTGDYKTGYGQTDKVHPSYLGAQVMARAAQSVWSRFPKVPAPIADHKLDATNLIDSGKGLFLTDANADGIADGWSSFSGTGWTPSIQTDSSGIKWQRITLSTALSGSVVLQWNASSLCAAGDVIELCARVQSSGFESNFVAPTGTGGGSGPTWGLTASVTGVANDVLAPAYGVHGDITDGVLYGRYTVAAGATGQIKVNLQAGGNAPAAGSPYVQFAQVALRNLTRLGIS